MKIPTRLGWHLTQPACIAMMKFSMMLLAYACLMAQASAASQPIGNMATIGDRVYLNDRIVPTDERTFSPPTGKLFVITDIVVQNRVPGDGPVVMSAFTRIDFTSPSGLDTILTIVGNDTLSEHFITGLPISDGFRLFNVINSTAPFVEFIITGTAVRLISE